MASTRCSEADKTMVISTALSMGSKNPLTIRLAGKIFVLQGDWLNALAVWQQGGDLYSLHSFAISAEAEGAIERAEAAYAAAFRLDPERTATPLADFLYRENRAEEAADILQAALTMEPDSSKAYLWIVRLGSYYLHVKQWEDLQMILALLEMKFPGDIQYYILSGWKVFEQFEDCEYARRLFNEAIARKPESFEGYYNMAEVLYREGNYKAALEFSGPAVSLAPTSKFVLLLHANVLREVGAVSEALALYQQIIDRFPHFTKPFYEKALAHQIKGERAEAIESLRNAGDISRTGSIVECLTAARVFAWAGLFREARILYQRVLSLDSSNSEAASALAWKALAKEEASLVDSKN